MLLSMEIVDEIVGTGGLAGLSRMTGVIAELETRRTELIEQLRSQRLASWDEIGQACGMTRQGASRRWSKQAQATSFGDAAAAYQRGRPPYPASAVDWLRRRGSPRTGSGGWNGEADGVAGRQRP